MREISLRRIALLALLSLGSSFSNGILTISTPNGISKSRFDDFSHTCLFRIPRMEEELQKCIESLTDALFHNDEPSLNISISGIQENTNIIVKNISEIRRKVGIRRFYGYADGRKFPEEIMCSSPLHMTRIAKVNSLPGIKLTNNFPSSRYECSWDMRSNNITNLIIPSVGINTLLLDMIKSKLFGHRLSYLYSGKMMIIWDLLVLFAFFIFTSLFKYGENLLASSYMQAICSIGAALFSDISKLFLFKILYDIAIWIPSLGRIITRIRKSWSNFQQGEN